MPMDYWTVAATWYQLLNKRTTKNRIQLATIPTTKNPTQLATILTTNSLTNLIQQYTIAE